MGSTESRECAKGEVSMLGIPREIGDRQTDRQIYKSILRIRKVLVIALIIVSSNYILEVTGPRILDH